MRLRSRKYSPHLIEGVRSQPWLKRLLIYSTVLLFLGLGDAIMSYYSPVYINQYVSNEFILGLIIATSSMFGLGCDILFGELFKSKSHHFFLVRAVLVALLFALSFIFFPPRLAVFIVSMALWGIYYELILFSDFNYINHALDHPHHSLGWSIIKTFTGVAYLIGPLLAGYLFNLQTDLPPLGALFMFFVAIVLLLLFRRQLNRRSQTPFNPNQPKLHLGHEFKLWRLLLPKLWPVLLFVFILTAMDATFWTVGSLLAEEMDQGGLLIAAYMLPSLFAGYLSAQLSPRFGKKRTAFVSGLICGLLFVASGFLNQTLLFILFVFIASVFQGMAMPEIFGAVEDYLERLGPRANALVGLENSTTSLAFIIGPILAGIIATLTGDRLVFAFMGGLITIISFIALLVVPRKIRLPQSAIAQIG